MSNEKSAERASDEAWRRWFERLGDKASAEIADATKDLVTDERLAALIARGILPAPASTVAPQQSDDDQPQNHAATCDRWVQCGDHVHYESIVNCSCAPASPAALRDEAVHIPTAQTGLNCVYARHVYCSKEGCDCTCHQASTSRSTLAKAVIQNAAAEIRSNFKRRFVIPSEEEIAAIIERYLAGGGESGSR